VSAVGMDRASMYSSIQTAKRGIINNITKSAIFNMAHTEFIDIGYVHRPCGSLSL
jgi:hypothetical protein